MIIQPPPLFFDIKALLERELTEHLVPDPVVVGLEEVVEVISCLGGKLEFLFFGSAGDLVGGADEATGGLCHGLCDVGLHVEEEVLIQRGHLLEALGRGKAEEALDLIQPRVVESPVRWLVQMSAQRLPLAEDLTHVLDLLEEGVIGRRGFGSLHGSVGHK